MEETRQALRAWTRIVWDARQTLEEAAAASGGRDPAGLLLLAAWMSAYAEDIPDNQAIEIGRALELDLEGVEREGIRLVLVEIVYDELFVMLRGGGWLDTP